MSIENLINREIDRQLKGRKHGRYGLVTSYNPKTHMVKVKMMPSGKETGWLRIGSSSAHKNSGLYYGWQQGDPVFISFNDGDIDTAVVEHGHWNTEDTPLQVPAGEMWYAGTKQQLLQHAADGSTTWGGNGYVKPQQGGGTGKAGPNGQGQGSDQQFDQTKSFVTQDASGNVTINAAQGGTVTINGATIVLAGTVKLGGADANTPAAMKGTTDTGGYADVSNLATQVFVK